MPEEREFRVGDLHQAALPERDAPEQKVGLDADVFPTLASFLATPSAAFRERLDRLTARARQESAPEAQAALQAAVNLLGVLYKKHGG